MRHGNPPFDKIATGDRREALRNCLIVVNGLKLPVVYGSVDKKKLSQQIYSTASPIDIAFRLCLEGVESYLSTVPDPGLGVVIADDSDKMKNAMKNAFRLYRRKVRSFSHNRGKLKHIVDEMYFGNSAYSIGIQMTDVCNWVNRATFARGS